jgi:hypothetical protein
LRPSSVVGGCLVAALLVCAPSALADDAPVTPAGWRVAPAGQEIGVSKAATGFQGPQNSALSPDGRMLLAASSGASKYQSADLFDLQSGTRTDTELYDAAAGRSVFYGVVFSPDGKRAWTSGGGENVVHSFTVDGDQLTPAAPGSTSPTTSRALPRRARTRRAGRSRSSTRTPTAAPAPSPRRSISAHACSRSA